MPYIPRGQRETLDRLIDDLAARIAVQAKEAGGDAAYAGLLNYTCTRLAMQVIKIQFGALRYWIIATTTGVFHNIADEFYRRMAVTYEVVQIEKNGDVDLYSEFAREIEMGPPR